MKKQNAAVKGVERILANIAKKSASMEANTACPLFGYQPKESEEIKKLRKF